MKKEDLILTFSQWLFLVQYDFEVVGKEIRIYPFKRNLNK